ncbi:DUF4157 domain-containing protein [Streptomyces sp. NPDC057301]|uniref:eCIS core domain-containing protein n=1 Tax=Streptomyces sp. NPDC057301 TaxID=3346093 RepID=UPI00363249E7
MSGTSHTGGPRPTGPRLLPANVSAPTTKTPAARRPRHARPTWYDHPFSSAPASYAYQSWHAAPAWYGPMARSDRPPWHASPAANSVALGRDRFERQADALAARVLAGGEAEAARGLLRAPAARFSAPGSAGRVLPEPLRGDLERALGADLGAVRVHTDAVAGTAVEAAGAQALAAGAHLYFAPGRFAPDTAGGRFLLAHELAHVLQQTAVAASRHPLRATAASGAGPAQATPREDPLHVSGVPEPPAFDEILRRHLAASPDNKRLRDAADWFRQDAEESPDGMRDACQHLADELLISTVTQFDPEVLALQTDLLKRAERWDVLNTVLDRHPGLLTCFYDIRAYTSVPEEREYRWVLRSWEAEPLLQQQHSVEQFLHTYRVFLLDMTRSVPRLGTTSLQELLDEQLARVTASDGSLLPGERTYVTLWAVRRADKIRRETLVGLIAELFHPAPEAHLLNPVQRMHLADAVAVWGLEEGQGFLASEAPEVRRLLADLAPKVREIGQNCAQFWLGVLQIEHLRASGGSPESWLREAGQQPWADVLEARLLPRLRDFFRLSESMPGEADALPDSREFLRARDTLAGAVRGASHPLAEAPLLAVMGDTHHRGMALVHGWVQFQLARLLGVLATVGPKSDDDALMVARIRTGRVVGELGSWLGRLALAELGLAVVESRYETQTKSVLALQRTWKPHRVPLSRMLQDFPASHPIGGLGGLTAAQLVDVYQTFYYERYAEVITRWHAHRPHAVDETVIQRAHRSLDSADMPTRWTVEDYEYAPNPEGQPPLSELIEDHPKTQAQLPAEAKAVRLYPARSPYQGVRPDVFVWTLPHPERLVDRLKQTAFSEIIARWLAPDAPDVTFVRSLPWDQWLTLLGKAEGELPESLAAVQEGIAAELRAERNQALRQLEDRMRQVSTDERHRRVEGELRKTLGMYERGSQTTRDDTPLGNMLFWDIPQRVLDRLNWLIAGLGPAKDLPFQLTAAVLELADTIRDRLTDRPRYDVVAAYQPVIQQVVALAEGAGASRLRLLLPQHGGTDAAVATWVRERVVVLGEVLAEFGRHQRKVRERFGVEGVWESGGGFLAAVGHGFRMEVGKPFTVDGVEWTLVKVHKPFVYHPRHGEQESALHLEGSEVLKDNRGQSVLVTVRRGADVLHIPENDDVHLAELAHAVTMAGLARQVKETAERIEEFAELAMDVAELVPGVGQAVMAARLAVTVLEFTASPDFQELVSSLFHDPQEAFKKWGSEIASVLTPQLLWEYLLFGVQNFDKLRKEQRTPAQPRPRRPGRTLGVRAAQIAGRLLATGLLVMRALAQVQTRVRWRVEAAQLFVLGHPLIDRVLHAIADHLEGALRLAGEGIHLAEEWEETVDGFAARVVEIAHGIADFELPNEIVRPGELVEIVVEAMVNRLPGKYKFGGKTALALLEVSGQKDAVFNAVAEAADLRKVNDWWRDEVRSRVAPPLTEARNDLADTIFDTLQRVDVFQGRMAAKLEKGKQTVRVPAEVAIENVDAAVIDTAEAAQAGAPETAPRPAGGGGLPARPGDPVWLPAETGRPLQPPVRRRYERWFGQDLRHVRVHTSPAAARAADELGALALTSGSHVYFAAGRGPGGDGLLAHELTHVLQQTGPHPLGVRAAPRPQPGTPGRGLTLDRSKESTAYASERTPRPGPLTAEAASGVQPKLSADVVENLFAMLTSPMELEKAVLKTAALKGEKDIPPEIRALVPETHLRAELDRGIERLKFSHKRFKEPDVSDAIRRHLARKPKDGVDRSLDHILRDSIVDKSKKGAPKPQYEVDDARLAQALARVVFGLRGVHLDIKMADKVIGKPPRISTMTCQFVHLALVHGNSDLWRIALSEVADAKKRAIVLPRLKARLVNIPLTDMWEGSRFRIKASLIQDVLKQAEDKRGVLPAAELPEKDDYLKTTGGGSDVGLRLSTYAQQSPPGRDRDSHHITQYLLLEYFTHKTADNTQRPFPLIGKGPDEIYPGLTVQQGEPVRMKARSDMNLNRLADKRGARMPTISLARETHRSARLHISVKDGDEENIKAESQSDLVHQVFQQALGGDTSEYLKRQAGGRAGFEAYVKGHPGGRPGVAAHIQGAMIKTYHWMRGKMEERLLGGLVGAERLYFNELAKQKSSQEEITQNEMVFRVYGKALAHARREMKNWGWD